MRWFKHMTSSADDEKLSRLVDSRGLEGYGFWWRVVEIVASNVDETRKTAVTYSIKKWCSLLVIRPQKFKTTARLCQDYGLFTLTLNEFEACIDIPNILKYRDEWTRKKGKNSGATPEQLLSKETDTDTEEERDLNTPPVANTSRAHVAHFVPEEGGGGEISLPDSGGPKKTDSPSKGNPEWKGFLSCFDAYPVKQGREDAWREWMRLKQNGTLAQSWEIRDAILRLSGEDSRWLRGKVPKMAKWLNGKGWDDEPYIEPAPSARASPPLEPKTYHQARDLEQRQMAVELLQRKQEKQHAKLGRDTRAIENGQPALPAPDTGSGP